MLYGTHFIVRDHANGKEWSQEFRTEEDAREAIRKSGLKHNIGITEQYRDRQGVVHHKGHK